MASFRSERIAPSPSPDVNDANRDARHGLAMQPSAAGLTRRAVLQGLASVATTSALAREPRPANGLHPRFGPYLDSLMLSGEDCAPAIRAWLADNPGSPLHLPDGDIGVSQLNLGHLASPLRVICRADTRIIPLGAAPRAAKAIISTSGTYGAQHKLSADALKGMDAIKIPAHAVKMYSPTAHVKLGSSQMFDTFRSQVGERNQIEHLDYATGVATLKRPLRDHYLEADSAFVQTVAPSAPILWEGGRIEAPLGVDQFGDPAMVGKWVAFSMRATDGAQITGLHLINIGHRGINAADCFSAVAKNTYWRHDAPKFGPHGYGFTPQDASEECWLLDSEADGFHLLFTTVNGGGGHPAFWGIPTSCGARNTVSRKPRGTGFDSHPGSRAIEFHGCVCTGAQKGFQLRGESGRIVDCEVNGATGDAISLRNETLGRHATYEVEGFRGINLMRSGVRAALGRNRVDDQGNSYPRGTLAVRVALSDVQAAKGSRSHQGINVSGFDQASGPDTTKATRVDIVDNRVAGFMKEAVRIDGAKSMRLIDNELVANGSGAGQSVLVLRSQGGSIGGGKLQTSEGKVGIMGKSVRNVDFSPATFVGGAYSIYLDDKSVGCTVAEPLLDTSEHGVRMPP